MLTWQETVIRLFIAAVLGGLIGLDRSRRDLGAGLRTQRFPFTSGLSLFQKNVADGEAFFGRLCE
jgi:hypothetical protein